MAKFSDSVVYVLDSSAIIRSNLDFSKGNYIISHSVFSELLSPLAKNAVEAAIVKGRIKVFTPKQESIKKVAEIAGEIGDMSVLSDTDIDVLAIGFEYDGVIISDDYAIQNVGVHLGVRVENSFFEKISDVRKYEFQCRGCGKIYEDILVDCPICGAHLRKKKKK